MSKVTLIFKAIELLIKLLDKMEPFIDEEIAKIKGSKSDPVNDHLYNTSGDNTGPSQDLPGPVIRTS